MVRITQRSVPSEQRLHFRGMSWRAKSSPRENVASARRVDVLLIRLFIVRQTSHCCEASNRPFPWTTLNQLHTIMAL